MLIDSVWCWLMLIGADWWWLRWLMLFDADSYRCHRVTHVGAYPRPLDVHYCHCYCYFRKILDSSAASSLLIGIHSHISATPPFAAMLMIPVQNICISDTLLTPLATIFWKMKNLNSLYIYRDTFYQYREDITKDIFKICTLRISLQTLPEAQRTQKLTPWLGLNLATTWHLLHLLQIWPPYGATCNS